MAVARRERAEPAGAARESAAERAARVHERRSVTVRAFYLVLASALCGLVLGVMGSELFAVREVVVLCENPSVQAEAAERAQGLELGTVWLPPARTIEREIGELPRVRSVTIHRSMPATLTLVVEARRPAAVVAAGERAMAIDAEGVCLHWTGSPPRELPKVRISDPSALEVGARLSQREVAAIGAISRGLEESGLLAGASIDVSHPLRICAITADGVLAKLGDAEMLYEKTLLFARLLQALRSEGRAPMYIDLRVPSRPTYKPVG
ncbi:MAG: cell division protein FtsQ/DivIB [Armatimonadota bacterium]